MTDNEATRQGQEQYLLAGIVAQSLNSAVDALTIVRDRAPDDKDVADLWREIDAVNTKFDDLCQRKGWHL